jgi:hypothetical protein
VTTLPTPSAASTRHHAHRETSGVRLLAMVWAALATVLVLLRLVTG